MPAVCAGTLWIEDLAQDLRYAGVTSLMLLVGLCAGLVPARRAARIDPVAARRQG